jgi:hypothetical protein
LWRFYQVITTTLPFLAPRKPEWRNNNKILSKNLGEIFSDCAISAIATGVWSFGVPKKSMLYSVFCFFESI